MTASQRISRADILELYKKPEQLWSESDVELLCHWNAQQEAAEKARIEKKKKEEEAFSAKRIQACSEYHEQLKQQEQYAADGTIDWFVRQLLSRHGNYAVPLRITEHAHLVPHYLEKAYAMEVAKRGSRYVADKNTAAIITAVSRWLTTHTKPGLMLRGYIGIGKTTMLYAIRDVLQICTGSTVRIVDARLVAALGRNSAEQLDELSRTELLGIDDLGTEPAVVKSYGNELSPVGELLTQRYVHRRFTLITTNLTTKAASNNGIIDELQEVYGDRLFDRFREMFNQLHYNPNQKSYRK